MQQQSAINNILDQPIDQLAFSDDFKRRAAQMEIATIRVAVGLSQKLLEQQPAFTNAWMDELTEYAHTCGFLDLLDSDDR